MKSQELEVFKSYILRKDISQFDTLIEVFDDIDQDIFPAIYRLYKTLITIPQTSCTVERLSRRETSENKIAIEDDYPETEQSSSVIL